MNNKPVDLNEIKDEIEETAQLEEAEAIDRAFLQMEIIYRSRCVQPPAGTNVVIREIDEKE